MRRRFLQLQKQFGSFKAWLDHHHPLKRTSGRSCLKNIPVYRWWNCKQFLMSTGYLPGAHSEDCKIYKKLLKANRHGNRYQKIVVIGPESTGKKHVGTTTRRHSFKQSGARNMPVNTIGARYNYSFDDLLTIAKGQLRLEDTVTGYSRPTANGQRPTFIHRTDMYVMKVWCEFVFEEMSSLDFEDRIAELQIWFISLVQTDLPWVKDELQEYPDEATRVKLYHYYVIYWCINPHHGLKSAVVMKSSWRNHCSSASVLLIISTSFHPG